MWKLGYVTLKIPLWTLFNRWLSKCPLDRHGDLDYGHAWWATQGTLHSTLDNGVYTKTPHLQHLHPYNITYHKVMTGWGLTYCVIILILKTKMGGLYFCQRQMPSWKHPVTYHQTFMNCNNIAEQNTRWMLLGCSGLDKTNLSIPWPDGMGRVCRPRDSLAPHPAQIARSISIANTNLFIEWPECLEQKNMFSRWHNV